MYKSLIFLSLIIFSSANASLSSKIKFECATLFEAENRPLVQPLFTKRLRLISLGKSDFDAIERIYADSRVQTMSGDKLDTAQLNQQFRRLRKTLDGEGNLLFGIYFGEDLIGVSEIRETGWGTPDKPTMAFGYHFISTAWGLGFATETVAKMIEFTFMNLGAHRIRATTLESNFASQNVLIKNGFTEMVTIQQYSTDKVFELSKLEWIK